MNRNLKHHRDIAGASITKALALHVRVAMCPVCSRWYKQTQATDSQA
jgi:hypothetical protein